VRVPEVVLMISFYVALTLTVVSGVDYIRRAAVQIEAMPDGPRR